MKTILFLIGALCAGQSVTIDAGSSTDAYFVGGSAFLDQSVPPMPDATMRYSATGFAYNIPLAPGFYKVTLTFYEQSKKAPGLRRFTVTANGQTSQPVDLYAMGAHDNRTPVVLRLIAPVSIDTLRLDFKAIIGNATLNSIAVAPYTIQDLPLGQATQGSVAVTGGFIDVFPDPHDADRMIRALAAFGDGPGVVCIAPGRVLLPCALTNGSFSTHPSGDLSTGSIYFGAPEVRYGEVMTYDATANVWNFPVYRPNPAQSVAIFANGVRLPPAAYTVNLLSDNLPVTVTITAPGVDSTSTVLADYVALGLVSTQR